MWIIYFFERIFEQIYNFLKHWYVDGFWAIYKKYMFVIKILDRYWALIVTLKHLFKPLYQDYTWSGYVFGVGFRVLRTLVASFIYLVITIAFMTICAAWFSFIPYLIIKTF